MTLLRRSYLLLVPITAMLTSCVATSSANQAEQVYVAFNTTNQKSSDFNRGANYEIAKNTNPNQQVNVDIMAGDRVKNIYSTVANRADIQHLDPLIQQISPADDRALIAAVKRVQEIAKTTNKLTAYIITSGTTDSQTLSAIASITEEIAQQQGSRKLRIYLLGLSPQNKIHTSAAFEAIAPTSMGGSCIDDYSQCRGFIDALIQ